MCWCQGQRGQNTGIWVCHMSQSNGNVGGLGPMVVNISMHKRCLFATPKFFQCIKPFVERVTNILDPFVFVRSFLLQDQMSCVEHSLVSSFLPFPHSLFWDPQHLSLPIGTASPWQSLWHHPPSPLQWEFHADLFFSLICNSSSSHCYQVQWLAQTRHSINTCWMNSG